MGGPSSSGGISPPAPPSPPRKSGYLVNDRELLVSSMTVPPIAVKRRLDYIARFPLPGEPGPEPIDLASLR